MVEFPPVVLYAIPFFAALMIVEMCVLRVSGRRGYETRDVATSLAMGMGNQALGLLTGALVYGAHLWVYEHRLFELDRAWWVFGLCFLGQDLAYYWSHRVEHEHRWMWADHVAHHSSQHYNLSTALRQTWTATLTFKFVFTLPLAWLGFEPGMIFFFSGISLIYQFWIHTEVIDSLGPLEWVLNTPSHHRVHHAFNARYLDANYGGILILWDRLFGSFIPECRSDPPRYGLAKNIATFNPLRVATHEWQALARDLRRARSPRELWGYTWGPPGWSLDGSRKTSAMLRTAWRVRQMLDDSSLAGKPQVHGSPRGRK